MEVLLMLLEDLISLPEPIHVADIGAAYITEVPPYKSLIDKKLARLSAFEADARQIERLRETYGATATIHSQFVGDGAERTFYVASAISGMSSLLQPSKAHLAFFNGFTAFGRIEREELVQTTRLDDIPELGAIDYLKMDIQGGELSVLQNAVESLRNCVAVQLEVSFVPLYEKQPTFGDVDVHMRQQGFLPHRFVDVKRWSIAPTIREGNFRYPFNQLLEADIVYVKDPIKLDKFADAELAKLAFIALYAYESPDLTNILVNELKHRESRLLAPATLGNFSGL